MEVDDQVLALVGGLIKFLVLCSVYLCFLVCHFDGKALSSCTQFTLPDAFFDHFLLFVKDVVFLAVGSSILDEEAWDLIVHLLLFVQVHSLGIWKTWKTSETWVSSFRTSVVFHRRLRALASQQG